jgi:hypothetical protein
MPLLHQPDLANIKAKLDRANEHLQEVVEIDKRFSDVQCEMVFTEDQDKGLGYFVVVLPKMPIEVSTIVGDCLHNLRSILDYLVWQLVLSNPPSQPGRRNMFPICSTSKDFESQVKGRRLAGVHQEAIKIIEKLQPYDNPNHPLALLDNLYNADKHCDLNYTLSVASDLEVSFSRNGNVYLQLILGNDEVRDGAILGNVGIPLNTNFSLPKVEVHGKAVAFVAFKDYGDDDALGVVNTLSDIRDFIVDTVLDDLVPFINAA